jgi:ferredoxin
MIATIDPKKCSGCGRCTQTCPNVFSLDGNRKVVVTMKQVPWGYGLACCEAAIECPTETIVLD